MDLKVIIEKDGEEFIASLTPEYSYLGFYGQGYSIDEAIEDFELSYDIK